MPASATTPSTRHAGVPLADGYYWVRLGELGESSKRLPWEIVELSDGHWQREQCDLRSVVDVGDRLEAQQLAPLDSSQGRDGSDPHPLRGSRGGSATGGC